jgi:abequosyltransferase
MSVKLSICIPTYNRGSFIKETVESIVSQVREDNDEVEIVISDNASTDNTEEIVRKLQKRFSWIVYLKSDKNQGADRNYLKVVSLAQGEYCWLMGSDDILTPTALDYMLEQIHGGHDIFLCNRTECSFDLHPFRDGYWLDPNVGKHEFDFGQSPHLYEYFDAARSLGALFSYLSVIVVRRSSWNSVVFDESYIGTAYSHSYIMLSIVMNGGTLKYLPDHLVMCRMGNDSFATDGLVKRLQLDLNGYLKLSQLISDANLRVKFLKVMPKTCPWYFLLRIKSISMDEQWTDIKNKLEQFHFSRWMIWLIGMLSHVKPFVSMILWARIVFMRILLGVKAE